MANHHRLSRPRQRHRRALASRCDAPAHGEVMVVTKRGRGRAATSWAQGGIAAVLRRDDSFEKHAEDTLRRGRRALSRRRRRPVRARGARTRSAGCPSSARAFSRDDRRAASISGARAATASGASCTPATSRGARSSARCSTRCATSPEHPRARVAHGRRPDHALASFGGPDRCVGRLRARRAQPGTVETDARARHGAGHRRRGQGLPLHVQPRRRDRRRRGDGVPRGRRDREHGVLPVPPDRASTTRRRRAS